MTDRPHTRSPATRPVHGRRPCSPRSLASRWPPADVTAIGLHHPILTVAGDPGGVLPTRTWALCLSVRC